MDANAKVFYLPTSKRPIKFGPVPPFIRDYWHVGIVFGDRVYENFSAKKFSISPLSKRLPELEEMGAEWQDVLLREPNNLLKFLKDGLSCDNYVEKVLGVPLTTEKYVEKREFSKEIL